LARAPLTSARSAAKSFVHLLEITRSNRSKSAQIPEVLAERCCMLSTGSMSMGTT